MRIKRHMLLQLIICAMCAALSGCGGSQEEEIPMGRYVIKYWVIISYLEREQDFWNSAEKLVPSLSDSLHPKR